MQWDDFMMDGPLQQWCYRHRWMFRAALAVVLLPLLGWYGWTRWTAEPVYSEGFNLQALNFSPVVANRPPVHLDRTAELVNALSSLPAPPVSDPSQQPAFPDISDALDRSWDPQDPYLQQVVQYFDNSNTRDVLAEITALSGEPTCVVATGFGQYSAVRQAAKTLVVRARIKVATEGDFTGAAHDLGAVMNLAAELNNDNEFISILVGSACHSLALHEILLWCQEYDLTPEQIAPLSAVLASHPFDAKLLWLRTIQSELEVVEYCLDRLYTQDRDGSAWMVPATVHTVDGELPHPIMRLLNLLSFTFPDRLEVVQYYQRYYAGADALSPVEANESIGSLGRSYVIFTHTEMTQRGAAIALALERFHHDQGHYPDSLSKLVPAYLSDVPLDPFDGRPVRYRLEADSRYLLWSVGENQTDEHGIPDSTYSGQKDYVLPNRRSEERQDH